MIQAELERISNTIARFRLKIKNTPKHEKVSRWKERIKELEQGYLEWENSPNKPVNEIGAEVLVPAAGGSK